MSRYYTFYNSNTGKKIDSGAYAGMPFFNKAEEYGIKRCAIKQDFSKNYSDDILEWAIDENSELFKKYYDYWSPWWTDYITRECIV